MDFVAEDVANLEPDKLKEILPTLNLIAEGRVYLRIIGKDERINQLARGLKRICQIQSLS